MQKKIIFVSVCILAIAIFKVAISQKTPIAVAPIARVAVSDIYDAKKHPNPFLLPKERIKKTVSKKRAVTKKAVVRKMLIINEPTLQSLRLTGIMLSGGEKQALLYDLNTRQTYFLIRGKLYDRDVKIVKGFSGQVLSQAVILEKANKIKTIALPGANK